MDKHGEDIEKQVYAEALRKASHEYEELLREFSILRLLNDSIQVGLGFTEICQKLVQFITEMLNVENASVMVLNEDTMELELLVGKGVLEETGTVYHNHCWPGKTFKIGEGIAGKAFLERKSILINDTLRDPRFRGNEMQKVVVRSILSIPLIHEDRVHGVLNISNSLPNAFTQKKEHALSVIASTASVALSYALTVEQLKQVNTELNVRNRELGAVVSLSEFLHANLELDIILEESLQAILQAFDVAGAAISLFEEGGTTSSVHSVKSHPPQDFSKAFAAFHSCFGSEMLRTRKEILRSLPADEFFEEKHPEKITFVGMPLFSGGQCIGFLIIIPTEGRAAFEAERRLLISFCSQIGMAIHNCQLIRRLRENIAELQEARRKLVQSEKLALLGEMVSSVAHEINNPLAAIQGYSDLLLMEKALAPEQKKMLERITLCVDRTRKIVQGLLSFSRKTELQTQPAKIHELIERALQHREHDFNFSNIQVVTHLEAGEPVVRADPNKIEQVFLNLINNAFDSMAESGGTLSIATRLAGTTAVEISFADTGPGVRKRDRRKIFEPFFTTKEVGKGTGLGLSISYGIIQEHGGTLQLDEEYTDGAKFVVTLPLTFEQMKEREDTQQEKISSNGQRGRILVVDDEEVVLEFMKKALQTEGFSVECVSEGRHALSLAKTGLYDLVISDIKMPGPVDGRRLFFLCQEEHPHLAERFIFITGDIAQRETAGFLEESGRPFLLKPFPVKTLLDIANETLGKSRMKKSGDE
jgi:signal transduction histidine kinase/putative methionine-R-sulfoxide reductase with GAF domain